ncbi:MAG: gamma-glutamylcyclotransferase [Comamonadaceae bacterium]|nr:gamma-glutamylcyclotransferase [Comamonadaceae bacterium]
MPEAPSTTQRHVFVYGTLRRGDDNDITRLKPEPVFVGSAVITGTLYDLGAYPGIRLDGEGLVQGEVYAIAPELEVQLDEIEELYPQQRDEYFKRIVPVAVQERTFACIVYEINPKYVVGRAILPGGDWARERSLK